MKTAFPFGTNCSIHFAARRGFGSRRTACRMLSTRLISFGVMCRLAMISDAVAGTRTTLVFRFERDFRGVVAMRQSVTPRSLHELRFARNARSGVRLECGGPSRRFGRAGARRTCRDRKAAALAAALQ